MGQSLKQLENIFSEETFNRKPLNNYTIEYFEELAKIVSDILNDNEKDEMIDLSNLALSRNAQHVISLFIMGYLSLLENGSDDAHFERLIAIFKNIKKLNIIEYLSLFVLKYHEAGYALKELAACYQTLGEEEKSIEILEKIVSIDKDNFELAERIAAHKEKEGNIDEAIRYYKIVFEHHTEKKHDKLVDCLKKILELKPDNSLYMTRHESQIADIVPADTMIDLWKIIFFYYFENGDYENALKIIKNLLKYEQAIVKQNNKKAKYFRHRLVDVYKALYPNHSLFADIEQMATLTNLTKDPKSVIEIFEKYIKYDKEKYVYHREFGIGIVKDLNTESIVVKFAKLEDNRKMTFEMVIKSLIVLEDDNVVVYKAYRLNELKQIAIDNPNEFMIMILKYREGAIIASKDLKHEVSPDIIPEASYTKWLDSAKKAVRAGKNVKFEKNTFVYNNSELSYDEEMFIKFSEEKSFINRYNIYHEYRGYSKNLDSEEAKKMLAYFTDIMADKQAAISEKIISMMFMHSINSKGKHLEAIDDVIANVDDYKKLYEELPSLHYKEIYIKSICKNLDNFADIIKTFLYSSQVKYHHLIIDKLVSTDNLDVLEKTIDSIIIKNREYVESFIFFAQGFLEKNMDKLSNGKTIKYNKTFVIIGLLNLINYLTKLADKKESSAFARKMLKIVYYLLFEKNYILSFIEENDKEQVRIVFNEFNKMIDLDNHYKTIVNTAIVRKFPDMM